MTSTPINEMSNPTSMDIFDAWSASTGIPIPVVGGVFGVLMLMNLGSLFLLCSLAFDIFYRWQWRRHIADIQRDIDSKQAQVSRQGLAGPIQAPGPSAPPAAAPGRASGYLYNRPTPRQRPYDGNQNEFELQPYYGAHGSRSPKPSVENASELEDVDLSG
ncbi:hypothetical protein GGS26DRAFT_601965 [Hypomontagnella submonticulosa]|nr:hypothetical protein GGS26DRAFT_601965 [Hypomontagnella submonticulosa]